MPKGKTDLKRFAKQEKRRLRNRSVRAAVKTYIGRARQALAGGAPGGGPGGAGEDTPQAAVLRASRELDRAARKGAIHQNNAARRKSRLVRRANALQAAATGA
jgi:small subunit ribosomal protein S20